MRQITDQLMLAKKSGFQISGFQNIRISGYAQLANPDFGYPDMKTDFGCKISGFANGFRI